MIPAVKTTTLEDYYSCTGAYQTTKKLAHYYMLHTHTIEMVQKFAKKIFEIHFYSFKRNTCIWSSTREFETYYCIKSGVARYQQPCFNRQKPMY